MKRRVGGGSRLWLAAVVVLGACSSSKSGGLDAAAGATGGAGATGSAGATGGGGAKGGADGGMCDPQYANGYEADFDITLAPGATTSSFCFPSCTGVSTTFINASGQFVNLYYAGGSCPAATACDTCTLAACPGHTCPPPTFPQTARWNGDIGVQGSCTACKTPGCGPAVACQSLGCAPPGHYTAKFCAHRAAPDGGTDCLLSAESCTSVEFDLPSAAVIPVQLQP
jgi:hypothetical protein